MEMRYDISTCSSMLKFSFLWKFKILGEKCVFTISDTDIREKSKSSLKCYWMG